MGAVWGSGLRGLGLGFEQLAALPQIPFHNGPWLQACAVRLHDIYDDDGGGNDDGL